MRHPASRGDSTYEQYLLALCEAEIAQRKVNRIERAIAAAKFPVSKDLSTFDFHQVGGISKARVLDLAQGGYIGKAETIIEVG
jgi:DNA replication protein DnaC